jgi:hypothetical protein
MIDYTNQIHKAIDKVASVITSEITGVPLSFDSNRGNSSFYLQPVSDSIIERFTKHSIREYTLLLIYEITTGGQYSENVFKQLSNISERVKVIFSGGQSSTVDEYFNGTCESVEYERDDENSKARANISITIQRLEV